MDPAYTWLPTLGSRWAPPNTAYAIGADYEPSGGPLRLVRLSDGLADTVFGFAPNDMIVPAAGVYDVSSASGFPIPADRRVVFDKRESVWHCAYLGHKKTQNALLGWLTGVDGASPARF